MQLSMVSGLLATTVLLAYLVPGWALAPVLLGVGGLWGWRAWAGRRRARAIAEAMTVYPETLADPGFPLAEQLQRFQPALRNWVFRGWNTAAGTLQACHVWRWRQADGDTFCFDLHVLPGFMPVAGLDFIPVVRTRHSALLIQRRASLPACQFWRMDWRDRLDVKLGFIPTPLPGGVRCLPYRDLVLSSADIPAAQALADQVLAQLESAADHGLASAGFYAGCDDGWLLLVFRNHLLPPSCFFPFSQ